MLILLERRVSHPNKTNKSSEVIHTRNSDSTEIKLPTLSLPTFSKVTDEWLTFSDLFQAAVINHNLTGAQKLQYLKGVLRGDAQKVVQSLPITDAKVFHPVVFDATNTDTGPNPPNVNNRSITSCSGFYCNSQVLLCTALVNVCDSFGGTRLCRVLLDPESQACLITNSCLERLVDCLGSEHMCVFHALEHQILELMVFRRLSLHLILHLIFPFVTSVYVVNKIVGQLPHFSLDSSWSETFSDLKLADLTFFKSGPIYILIDVNIALPMLKDQSLSLGDNKPFAFRSDLGWLVAENVPSEEVFSSIQVNSIQVVTDDLVTFGS
ncbi:DUF1758 domain-containing protein [Trichonephila inaurata madagascariensis]|uniref:DUF1758 domain-containing protein n=1 Tax=Trichonephila inaurata madagascariensis TaxID=2747483 RepID=A0A8X6YHB4_9ARAC|nr:DUF1758 domain-containing protein [Trichonephila inaurata madagascariensis]GFY70708.1 DUF1758 domain-containing protein [Trichonephila inaurata madagascariensis]